MSTAFDFSTAPDRRGSDSVKWNRPWPRAKGGEFEGNVLPLWVADMDFAAPEPVVEAIRHRLAHPVFGYGHPGHGLTAAVTGFLARHYGWEVAPDWLVWLPGVVSGFNVGCRLMGEEGDGVVVPAPVYPPFFAAPGHAGRRLLRTDLVERATSAGLEWGWDWPALDALLADPQQRAAGLLLCHPHNPVGRAWRRDELEALAERVLRHDLVVVSDDIHADLQLVSGARHLPLVRAVPELASRTVTLFAPSKTFNIPGLYCAFAVIPDAGLRQRFRAAARGFVPEPNLLGLAATEVAYRDCDDWLAALLATLRGNADRLVAAVAGLPGVAMARPEATYLGWLDCRGLQARLPQGQDPAAFFEAHGLGLSNGADFGLPGFVRLNFGCPPARLDVALARLVGGVTGLMDGHVDGHLDGHSGARSPA